MTEIDDLTPTPHELIRQYYPLQGAVSPLVELLQVSPNLAESIIELTGVCPPRGD